MNAEIKKDDGMKQTARSKEIQEGNNPIGKLLLLVGTVVFIIGLVITLFLDISWYETIMFGLMVAGFGEIINLLQKIYVNTKK